MFNKIWYLYYLNSEKKPVTVANFRSEEEARYYLEQHKNQLPLYDWNIDFIDFEVNVRSVDE